LLDGLAGAELRRPMKSRLTTALLVASMALTGCGYTYHFKNVDTMRGEEHNEWASFFLFGIVGDYELDVRDFCPNGVHEITTGTNFLTWLVSTFTIGIYTPRKVNVWCSAGERRTSYSVDFGDDGKPKHVTKRVGSLTYSGEARPTGDGRWGVTLREGGPR
jgi:hypothetical protein